MRSVTVRLEDLRTMILNLGFVGENEHRKFNFDCKKMFGEYPSASVSLTVQPPAGDCYPATVERNGDLVSWTVTDSDLIEEGCGEVQLTFMVGDVKAKTCIGRTKVERSLGATGDIPTPIENWIEQAEEVISEAEAATAAAEDAAEHQPIIDDNGYWTVWDADAEEYVATEYKAQGTDGHDGVGIVSIEKTGTSGLVDTYTITFTSGNPVTYTVTNGRDADPADLIDDNAGAGDTDKVWSADKSHELLTEINSRYTKPNTGIPATDMASSVQTSLNNADSAYQKPQTGIPASDMAEGVIPDISGKADKTVTDALQKNKAPVIIDSAEGNPIVLTDGADGLPIEVMKIHFLPKQDTSGGDPSPSNVCPISGWTGVTAYRSGKNMLDPAYKTTPSMHIYFYKENGIYLPAGKYTLSCSKKVAGLFVHTMDNTLIVTGYKNTAKSFTLSEGQTVYINFYDTNIDSTMDCQLEVGETASPFAEYTGQSYPVTFPALGANQFNGVWEQGNISGERNESSTTAMRTGFIDVDPSTAYYAYTTRTSNVILFEYDEDGTYLNNFINISNGKSFTTSAATKKVRICDRNSGTESVNTGINYPATVTTYEPYTNTVYGGTLDAVNGVLTVEWGKTFLDSMTFQEYGSTDSVTQYYTSSIDAIAKDRADRMSNVFHKTDTKEAWAVRLFDGSEKTYFCTPKDEYGSTEAFKTAMQELGAYIVYELATTIEIPLDPITVQTLIGDNTIWSDANGTIELDYRADTKLFIAKQKTDIRATIAPIEDGTTASQAYSAGKFFYHDGQFCKAKTSIASGATFTLNTNYEITTVADELFALN